MTEHPLDPDVDPDEIAEGAAVPDDPGFGNQDEQLLEEEWKEAAAEGGEFED